MSTVGVIVLLLMAPWLIPFAVGYWIGGVTGFFVTIGLLAFGDF